LQKLQGIKMERLIIEYSEGDGYTYSCTNTFPLLYESKEKAISDLESLLLQYQIDQEVLLKERDNYYKKLQALSDSITNLKSKKGKEKELEKVANDFLEFQQNNRDKFSLLEQKFTFGGQELYYDHFFERDGGEKILIMPSIYTLDEFFKDLY
jgi:hypothetical protein